MADLIAFFSRKDENYVNGMLKKLDVGNTEVAAGIIQKLTGGIFLRLSLCWIIPPIITNALLKHRKTKKERPVLN